MKPAWDALAEEYSDATSTSSVLIADVDCTAEGKSLCEKHEIRGYPTIKYIQDGKEHTYQKGRDLDSLRTFVKEHLEVPCTLQDTAQCSEKELQYMEKMKPLSKEEKQGQLERLKSMSETKMKADLKAWLHKRIRILQQFVDEE